MKYNIVFKNHLLQAAASNSVRKNKQAKITTIGCHPPHGPGHAQKKQCYHPLTSHQPWEGLTSNTRENQCNFYCVGWCG